MSKVSCICQKVHDLAIKFWHTGAGPDLYQIKWRGTTAGGAMVGYEILALILWTNSQEHVYMNNDVK